MPFGLTRYQETGKSHFVTFTCYHHARYLNEAARDVVVDAIEQARKHYSFCVYAFAIMPDHVHLLMSEPERGLVANAIQSLKIASARRSRPHLAATERSHYPARGGPHLGAAQNVDNHGSSALKCGAPSTPLWQKRYFDRNVRDNREFERKLRYTHWNPVMADLVQKPQDWKWSSYRHYLTGEWCGVEIESQWTATDRERRGIIPSLREN